MRIRTSMWVFGLTLGALAASPAFAAGAQAATAHKTMTPQQQKMADCSRQSKGTKGDAHKKFMSDCLHGKTMATAPARTTQQEKMKTCNADAKTKGLKGTERKTFMSTCLKGG